jgi:hypothetical protein
MIQFMKDVISQLPPETAQSNIGIASDGGGLIMV